MLIDIYKITFLANQCFASTVNQTFIFRIKNFIENSKITNLTNQWETRQRDWNPARREAKLARCRTNKGPQSRSVLESFRPPEPG